MMSLVVGDTSSDSQSPDFNKLASASADARHVSSSFILKLLCRVFKRLTFSSLNYVLHATAAFSRVTSDDCCCCCCYWCE